MELNYHQRCALLQRFPTIELSYETILHNKVKPHYNFAIAIALGKKCFVWFSFQNDQNVCYIMELNKDKNISKITVLEQTCITPICNQHSNQLYVGTVLYGTLAEQNNDELPPLFIVEDIYYSCGIPLKQLCFGDKMPHLVKVFKLIAQTGLGSITFAMAGIWRPTPMVPQDIIPSSPILATLGYVAHHIQYRATQQIVPYLNVAIAKPAILITTPQTPTIVPKIIKPYICHPNKPQYNQRTVFVVKADKQFDVYHLYAFGKHKELVYYNVAGVQTYKQSVFLNSIFRKIRENKNLDYIEESEDESDFQDLSETKYVDLEKKMLMECVFHPKLKLWIPEKVVDKKNVVHISSL